MIRLFFHCILPVLSACLSTRYVPVFGVVCHLIYISYGIRDAKYLSVRTAVHAGASINQSTIHHQSARVGHTCSRKVKTEAFVVAERQNEDTHTHTKCSVATQKRMQPTR